MVPHDLSARIRSSVHHEAIAQIQKPIGLIEAGQPNQESQDHSGQSLSREEGPGHPQEKRTQSSAQPSHQRHQMEGSSHILHRRTPYRQPTEEAKEGERIGKQGSPLLQALAVSYTHLRAHETKANLVCRLLL